MANARAKKRCASASNKPRPEAPARLVVKSSRAQPAHRNKALPCHAAGGLLFIYSVVGEVLLCLLGAMLHDLKPHIWRGSSLHCVLKKNNLCSPLGALALMSRMHERACFMPYSGRRYASISTTPVLVPSPRHEGHKAQNDETGQRDQTGEPAIALPVFAFCLPVIPEDLPRKNKDHEDRHADERVGEHKMRHEKSGLSFILGNPLRTVWNFAQNSLMSGQRKLP